MKNNRNRAEIFTNSVMMSSVEGGRESFPEKVISLVVVAIEEDIVDMARERGES